MKKILFLLIFVLTALTNFAQVVIHHDTVTYYAFPKNNTVKALKDSITNNGTTPVTINWSKTYDNLLTGWTGVGICDKNACYSYDGNGHSFTLDPGETVVMYVDMKVAPTATDGTVIVVLTTNFGPMVFKFISEPTSVKDMDKNPVATLYPNPATNYVNLSLSNSDVSSISVLNVVGKRIARFDVTPNLPNPIYVPLDNVAEGVYLLQFNDANGKTLGTKRLLKK